MPLIFEVVRGVVVALGVVTRVIPRINPVRFTFNVVYEKPSLPFLSPQLSNS
jgi:hypothetical protein